jgi:hypothetical protein
VGLLLRLLGRRLVRLGHRAAIIPLRARGILLAAVAAYVAWGIGKKQADYLLYVAGICAIALVGLCILCVLAGALRVWLAVRRTPAGIPTDLETTQAVPTGFRFPRLTWWPLVETRMTWEGPAGVDVALEARGNAWVEVITARARGRHAQVIRRFTVEDVFGLAACSFTVAWEEPVRIAPARAVASAELAVGYATGDAFSHPSGRAEGDLVEMRAYGHGDPMRHVLWKTFARSRRLLVRMPERAIAPSPTTVAFLIAGPGDEPSCGTARLYLERNLFGADFLFGADGAAAPARDRDTALDQIIDSAGSDGGSALDQLGKNIDPMRLASCVVFAPAVDGPWRERVVAFAARPPAPPTIVIGVDGAAPRPQRSRLARMLVRRADTDDADGRAMAEVGALREALEASGLRVQVVHRSTGQAL